LIGGNFRLDTIQCAVLRLKLPQLDVQHNARRKNASYYDAHLADVVEIPRVAPRTEMIYNQYTIRTPKRDGLAQHLAEHQIGHAIYYPLPLHLQVCFAHLGYKKGQLPEAEKAAAEALSLPIFPGLTAAQAERVCTVIRHFFARA
jgi:dTDP-4-amino-4,6-dideoxygalactose transaminase